MKNLNNLSKRWYPLRYHAEQERLVNSTARFKIVPSGRRSGKTERAKRNLVEQALRESIQGKYPSYKYFAAAPTRTQAKRIFWDDLKALIPNSLRAKPVEKAVSESELRIKLITGAEIYIIGLDRPERMEGILWCGGVLDELANCKETCFSHHIRPALSTYSDSWCWLIGVPEGRNFYYDMYIRAKTLPDWDAFTWKSIDILPASEIESARAELDERTFQQEYEASFLDFAGKVYYAFNYNTHCHPLKYDPKGDLIFTFDFNVAPGTASILQEQVLPNGEYGTGIIGEVHIPRNSTTVAVCEKLVKDWGNHQGRVLCFGDATGGASGSAKVKGSDWDLIKAVLYGHFKTQLEIKVKKFNPRERVRVNAMNSRLKSTKGIMRMMVDSAKCPNIVKDFDGVSLLEGGSGEIDKKATPNLTHLTDGIGYYINSRFPLVNQSIIVNELF